jgi:hypothetical protein
MQRLDCNDNRKSPRSESEEPQQLVIDHNTRLWSKCIILTDFHTALANTSHPKFIRMAGAARMINVGAIGNTVTMNVIMNIMAIITQMLPQSWRCFLLGPLQILPAP